ncbi:helix-turn-helix domain-containing protein [Verrucosispora sp. NA02020]|uniref:helix-turn-helix domain-containing protein n=1 Tax=Verrucosispora sp. NA02020 TaxID=2742132 RepID=UPI00158FCC48|nr:helix-turn-helix domain-containing protein [Verrucosispora sp. NA02020]QKW15470.1 helix-turn-helix domain-containing protein [Verrucosispora sp. NA02020]
MPEDLGNMSLPEADRHARAQIEYHREQMGTWKRARAQRIVTEYDAGRTVEEIAADLGVSAATVYEVMRAVQTEPKKRGRRPKKRDGESPT